MASNKINRYHFSGSKVSTSLNQPLHLTKFVSTWIIPTALQAKYGNVEVIDEQLQDIKGLDIDKLPATVEQKYYGTSRKFTGTITDTSITVKMTFECNKDAVTGEIYPYCLFRDWNKLQYDAETGLQTEKEDYTGSVVILVNDIKGGTVRKVTVPIAFMTKAVNEWELSRVSDNIYKLSLEFAFENVSAVYKK